VFFQKELGEGRRQEVGYEYEEKDFYRCTSREKGKKATTTQREEKEGKRTGLRNTVAHCPRRPHCKKKEPT